MTVLSMKRILDLGCGSGKWPQRLGPIPSDCLLIGVDLSPEACLRAARQTGALRWLCASARAEQLPLRDQTIDQVISTVALPYFNIPSALREIWRVLKPGGHLDATLHSLPFTVQELRARPPSGVSSLFYRFYVIANGFWFHLTGSVMRYPFSARYESWQSQRGIRIAFERAGFAGIRFSKLDNAKLIVQAMRPASDT
jgi:ubiquinone/menaquinone biosynthesis C-methylase UbiE